jgi:MFS family permease
VQALLVAGAFGFMFLSALYMQQVLGYEPAQVGLAILPAALVIGAVSLGLSARLTARFGARAVLLPGLAVNVSGLLLLRRVPVDGEYLVDLLPAIVLLAFGFGLAMPALTALAMSSATPSDSGLASGLFNTTQQVGGALGLAVLATLAASRTDALLAGGDARAAALTGGYQLAFTVAAGFVLAAVVVAAVVLRREEPAVADAPSLVVEMDGAVAPAPLPGVGSGAPAGVERDGAGASVVVASADRGAAGEGEVAAGPLPAH